MQKHIIKDSFHHLEVFVKLKSHALFEVVVSCLHVEDNLVRERQQFIKFNSLFGIYYGYGHVGYQCIVYDGSLHATTATQRFLKMFIFLEVFHLLVG